MSAPSEGRMAYDSVAEELPELKLSELDENTVRLAKEYAKRSHKAWPPKPQNSGWQVRVWSM